ncbi:MAG: FG-GAP-like repeat-containing protein [Bacteroidota bacterium]
MNRTSYFFAVSINLWLWTASFLSAQTVYQFESITDVKINGIWTVNGYGDGFLGSDFDFVDLDHDGDMDLVTGTNDGRLHFYRNDCRPDTIQWTLVPDFWGDIHVPFGAASPSFADVNGDGLEDLFIGNGTDGGKGGHIAFYLHVGTADSADWMLVSNRLVGIDMHDRSTVELVDVDQDGDKDILAGGGLGGYAFHENIGSATHPVWDSANTATATIIGGFRTAHEVVDFDQDGLLDLFVTEAYGNLQHYEDAHPHPDTTDWQLQTLSFLPWDACKLQNGCLVRARMIDIDNDQDLDVFITGTGFQFFRNDGTAQAPQWTFELPNYPVIGDYRSIADLVDLDGDHKEDLLHLSYNGLAYYKNTGSIQQAAWQFVPDTFTSIVVPRMTEGTFWDWDGDHDLDMIVGTREGHIQLFNNQGDSLLPHFVPQSDPFFDLFDHGSSVFPLLIDLFEDDTLDLVISSHSLMYHFIDRGTGPHPSWELVTTQLLPLPPSSNSYGRAGFIDFDMDGDQDVFLNGGLYRNHGTDAAPNWIFEEVEIGYDGLPTHSILYPHDFLPNCGIESMINVNGNFRLFTYKGVQPEILNFFPSYLCSNTVTHTFDVFPTGGYWSGDVDSSGVFQTSQGVGVYTVYYHYPDPLGCKTLSDSISFFVRQGPELVDFLVNGSLIGDTLCLRKEDSTQVLVPSPAASGSWGGVANWQGAIEPASLDSGLHWATFRRYLNGCEQIDSIPVKFCLPTSLDEGKERFPHVRTFPNPFSNELYIEFSLSEPAPVQIEIVTLMGQRVRSLMEDELSQGEQLVSWDGRDDSGHSLPSALYHLIIRSSGFVHVKKIHLFRE